VQKWMSDEAKDLYTDMTGSEHPFNEATCATREKLLKALIGNGHKEANQHRYLAMRDLGMCEFNSGNFKKAQKHLDSGASELNLPNDDMMLTNPIMAPTGYLREASKFMQKHELTQAATALRRSKEISDRNLKSGIKNIHKQMSSQEGGKDNLPPVDNIIDELSGYGRTGQILPQVMKQAPFLAQEMPFAEQLDKEVEEMDKRLLAFAPQSKAIRKTLDTSKGSKGGSLMYARGLVTEPTVPGDRLMAAMDMVEGDLAKAFKEEGAAAEKSSTLLKRTKEGPGCAEGKGMEKTCKALSKIPDLKSNCFGETRVMVLKAGKDQPLESCSTNANVGILLAAKDGVTATVAGTDHNLVVGLPLVVDFCQVVALKSEKQAAVLFAQAWHPEFAAVERTSELRSRAQTFSISKDEEKEATKIVNDHAKKNWEKSAKQWRKGSAWLEGMISSLQGAKDAEKKAAEEAAEAKRKEEYDGDEGRKKGLEELERKRAEKKEKAKAAEEKRKANKARLEEEKAHRDPWLNDPAVEEAQANLDGLKEQRRDASAKLEFDLTAELTKDIAAAERALKKATKVAKKAFKKSGGDSEKGKEEKAALAKKNKEASEAKMAQQRLDMKKKLKDAKDLMKKAADEENYKEAKRLKEVVAELEEKSKKLGNKDEL